MRAFPGGVGQEVGVSDKISLHLRCLRKCPPPPPDVVEEVAGWCLTLRWISAAYGDDSPVSWGSFSGLLAQLGAFGLGLFGPAGGLGRCRGGSTRDTGVL